MSITPAAAAAADTASTKRPHPDSDPTSSPTSKRPTIDESNFLDIRALVTKKEAATIIGKGGENVASLREQGGARISLSENVKGSIERILTVTGTPETVAKTFGLLVRTLTGEPASPSTASSKTYALRLLIPHSLLGHLIGPSGTTIREIQSLSNARLNASEGLLPLSTERALVVVGVADAVHIALWHVCERIREKLAKSLGRGVGILAGVVGYNPVPVVGIYAHPARVGKRALTEGMVVGSMPYGAAAVGAIGAAVPVAAYGGGAGAGYAAAAATTVLPSDPQAAAAYATSTPVATGPYVGPSQPSSATPAPAGAAVAPLPGQPLTQNIYIPNDMVGAIIGKGGAKINEIRQMSGSHIKINEPADNSAERLVTITGTPEANQMALYMLYSRLEQEKHRV
ncbi:PAB1 binding protein [Saitoella coloradoensis]